MIFRLLGVIFYILSAIIGIGQVINFILSVFKWDFSPWWFWPAGIATVLVLLMISGNLFRLGTKE